MFKIVLKKSWSRGGRSYPPGTAFTLNRKVKTEHGGGAWYDFVIPGKSYGTVYLPGDACRALTEEEHELKRLRAEAREEHIKACDPMREK